MAFPIKMKPETVAKRATQNAEAKARSRELMLARLAAKAREEGPDSIWAEMLAEAEARA